MCAYMYVLQRARERGQTYIKQRHLNENAARLACRPGLREDMVPLDVLQSHPLHDVDLGGTHADRPKTKLGGVCSIASLASAWFYGQLRLSRGIELTPGDQVGRCIHPVSITRFPRRRFSPGAGLLRNLFVHR